MALGAMPMLPVSQCRIRQTARAGQEVGAPGIAEQVRRLRRELAGLTRTIYANLTPWETVLVSRCDGRPQTRDYIALIFDQFVELHGDRAVGDDKTIVTGFGHLGDTKVMFVGHQKGKNASERIACNFGCAHPEGYRKALRLAHHGSHWECHSYTALTSGVSRWVVDATTPDDHLRHRWPMCMVRQAK